MNNVEFVFIPSWVETVLNRNSYTFDDCLNYDKLRQILSLEDITGFLALQELDRFKDEIPRALFNSWKDSATGAYLVELDSTVYSLSRSNELKEELLLRLSSKDSNTLGEVMCKEENNIYYKVVDINKTFAALIVYPGFFEFVKKPENEYKILVDQLKILYIYMKVFEVSFSGIFKKYVKLLANRFNSMLV